jgi:NADH-quinone oxidoreductase subunit E
VTVQDGRAPVLTGNLRAQADAIVAKYPNSRSAVLPLLFLVQSAEGYVSEDGMREIADILNLTPAQILAAMSFYTMFKKQPQGTYLISVCRNIACTHLGGRELVGTFEQRLGIKAGETTPNGKFTLETAECLATCDGAPSLQVNYEDFYKVTPEAAEELVDKLERGDEVRSVRGQVVRDSRAISRETACAGLRFVPSDMESMRTIGGESPRVDTAPGFRPKVEGHNRDDEEGDDGGN